MTTIDSNNLFHPNNSFIEFTKAEIEQSITNRFAQQVKKHSQNLAIQTNKYKWTYAEGATSASKSIRGKDLTELW